MSTTHSTSYTVFGTTREGGASSYASTHSLATAREQVAKMREDADIVRVRVRKDGYALGGGERTSEWIYDGRRA